MSKKVKTLDRHTLEQAIACVPTNWTDDILVGPNAALRGREAGRWAVQTSSGYYVP